MTCLAKLILAAVFALAPGGTEAPESAEPQAEPQVATFVCVREDVTRVVDGKLRRDLEAKGYTCEPV